MITIEKGQKHHFDRTHFDVDRLRLLMLDDRFKKGITDYSHIYFDLTQLHGVQLVYEAPDIQRRQVEAAERSQQERDAGIIYGGIVGGMVDSAIGEDDSILDGVLFGAAIGAATSGISKIDLKEQSSHQVNLLFKNGESCRVLVDAAGMADLARAWHKAFTLYADTQPGDHMGFQQLSEDELSTAGKANTRRSLKEHHKKSSGFYSIGGFLLACAFIAGVPHLSNHLTDQRHEYSDYATTAITFCFIAGFYFLIAGFVQNRKENNLLPASNSF